MSEEFKDLPGDPDQLARLAHDAFHNFDEERDFEEIDQAEKERWLLVADQLKAQFAFDYLVFQGEKEDRYGTVGDELFLMAEAIGGPAQRGALEKSHQWRALYVTVVSGKMKRLSKKMPGLMAHVLFQPEGENEPQ